MPPTNRYLINQPPQLLKRAASLRFTTVCLALLLLLTVAGTLYQVRHGIYAAKAHFFVSWLAPVAGIPLLPGGKTVMVLLSTNLIAAMLTRFPLRIDRLGLWLLHAGLLVLCAGAFGAYLFSRESMVVLRENECTGVSVSEREWELSFWPGTSREKRRKIIGVPVSKNSVGRTFDIGPGLRFRVERFIPHCRCRTARRSDASGGFDIQPLPPPHEPAEAEPAVVLEPEPGGAGRRLVLWAGDPEPTSIRIAGKRWNARLRKRRYPLPFTIRLLDIRRTVYPGTEIPQGYQSTIEIGEGASAWRAVISMNHPLSAGGITLYQSGYAVDRAGRESSTLQVVRNPVRFLPYAGSILGGLGLIVHFLTIPLLRRQRPDSAGKIREKNPMQRKSLRPATAEKGTCAGPPQPHLFQVLGAVPPQGAPEEVKIHGGHAVRVV